MKRYFLLNATLTQFIAQQMRCERRCIYRGRKAWPEPPHCPNMVFMGMGENDRENIALVSFKKLGVRQD